MFLQSEIAATYREGNGTHFDTFRIRRSSERGDTRVIGKSVGGANDRLVKFTLTRCVIRISLAACRIITDRDTG